MPKYACVDVGGTFTDAAILDESGEINIFKATTTPQNWTVGIINVLETAAKHYGQSTSNFLKDVSTVNGGLLTHGSTIATNVIIEKKAGKVGMMCTKGFRDVLLFREGPNKHPFNMCIDYPEPFVPRYLTLPIEERINSEGGVETDLNEDDVVIAVKKFKEYNVEAICICFLWSTANPAHEKKTAEIIKSIWPEVQVVLSSEVNPCNREYQRWVSAAMDASLRKVVSTYATDLNNNLADLGLMGEIGMLNSSGGIMSTDEIVKRPLYSVDSGPSMAPVSGKWYVNSELNEQNVVVLDMGGTTFDVSCVIDGNISVDRDALIGNEILGIPRVKIHSIGAGGGSIAWVDSGGMIRVGPQSAGSDPGPACYGLNGTYPTVTDANLVLGYINPEFFNGGKMVLYPELARNAIKEHIADKLGISIIDAAYAVWTTVNENMIFAIKDITIWQGIDPREHVMVSGGGACGLHAIALAEGIEMKKILIPKTAGGLSAVGGIFSDTVSEENASLYMRTDDFNFHAANELIQRLYKKAIGFFEKNKIPEEQRQIELYMEGHYPFQTWEIPVNITPFLNSEYAIDEDSVSKIVQMFHKEHERIFSVKEDTYVECVSWRIKAIGKREIEIELTEEKFEEGYVVRAPHKRTGSRKVYFKPYGSIITPVFAGENLIYGDVIQGPAIIEEPTMTVLVLPKYEARVTKYNNYYIEADLR